MNATIDTLLLRSAVALTGVPGEKRAAIEFLVNLLVDAGRVHDRERALEDVFDREAEATTEFGLGVAIPHARTEAVAQPSVAFARPDARVDFGGEEEADVTLLFLLLAPPDVANGHLDTLSALSRALVHDAVRANLRAAETPADVRRVLGEFVG